MISIRLSGWLCIPVFLLDLLWLDRWNASNQNVIVNCYSTMLDQRSGQREKTGHERWSSEKSMTIYRVDKKWRQEPALVQLSSSKCTTIRRRERWLTVCRPRATKRNEVARRPGNEHRLLCYASPTIRPSRTRIPSATVGSQTKKVQ